MSNWKSLMSCIYMDRIQYPCWLLLHFDESENVREICWNSTDIKIILDRHLNKYTEENVWYLEMPELPKFSRKKTWLEDKIDDLKSMYYVGGGNDTKTGIFAKGVKHGVVEFRTALLNECENAGIPSDTLKSICKKLIG